MTAAATPALIGPALRVTAIALALGTFMQVLDSAIANVSLPTIAGNLGASTDDATWVVTAFAAANGVTVPLTGWLMGRFGVVRTFVVSVALFTITSFLCGIATSLPMLTFFRLLQGGVSGPMIPGSQALLIAIFPEGKRAAALGIWSVTALVGPVVGPVLGGYISDNYYWGLIFLINVPVGLFSGLISWRALRSRETATRKLPIDMVGVILLATWVGALQVVLDLGKNDDWFNSRLIVVLTVIAVIAFATWVIWELTDAHPAVDLESVAQPKFLTRNGSLLSGLCPVLRHQPTSAGVAPAAVGLYRDLGGAGLSPGRGGRGHADAVYRPLRRQTRRALAGHRLLRRFRHLLFHAGWVYDL